MSRDGKCPDIYECRLGADKVMRQLANAKLRDENEQLRASLSASQAEVERLKRERDGLRAALQDTLSEEIVNGHGPVREYHNPLTASMRDIARQALEAK